MNEKTIKILAGAIITFVVIVLAWQLITVAPTQPPEVSPVKTQATSEVVAIPGRLLGKNEEITAFPGSTEIVANLNSKETEPIEDIQMIQEIFTVFRKANGKNPFGSENFEIVAGLIGNNEKKIGLLAANHPAINENGELTDRWGTPYFFHAETSTDMQVVSAGPDKQLFTKDDVQLPEAMSAPKENHELPEEEIVLTAE